MSNFDESLLGAALQATPTVGIVDDPNKDFYSELVGDGKKYADEKALAKGAYHKDQHIARLEQEQAQLREELNKQLTEVEKRLTLEEAVERMTSASNQQVASQTPANLTPVDSALDHNANVSTPQTEGMTPEQIQELVTSTLTQNEQLRQEQSNLDIVKSELQKAWGDGYQNVLRDKANQLGVNDEFLVSIAKSSPEAALRLVGAKDQAPSNTNLTPPVSSVNTSGTIGSSGSVRDRNYYNNLRRSDPRTYWLPKTQTQMHKDHSALGDKFFGN